MMVGGFLILSTMLTGADAPAAPAPIVDVEKQIVYKKDTNVDLTGSNVQGENGVPPAFFVDKMKTPKAESLLEQRLKFSLKKFNETGF